MTTLTMSSPARSRRSSAEPRWATRRRPERPTLGGQVAEVARLLGTPLLPWQRYVADVGLEIDPITGLLAYREVWFSVMRQSGKTTLALPWEVHRCISPTWDGPQRVAYTAQTGWEAQKKLIEDQVPILERSPLKKLITPKGGGKVRRAQGNWGVNFGTGSRIDVLGSSASAGHGQTLDLGVIDEAWKDEDDRREQSMLPAMITRPMAQLLGYSTMGTDASIYLNRKAETGRAATVGDTGRGLAYFEWSIPPDADIDDPETWWRYMPALGWTITEAAVAHARQTMQDGEYRRAFGNQRVSGGGERVIPHEFWDRAQSPGAEPNGPLLFGVDVLDDRSAGAVAVVGGDVVEVVDHRPGTAWMVDRVREVVRRQGGSVVVDGGGPAAPIADELERVGVRVKRLTRPQVADACARMYDALADDKVRFRITHTPLDEGLADAVDGLAKQPMGDRFVWSRKASTKDVTPFFAATVAFGVEMPPPQIHDWPDEDAIRAWEESE